MVKAHVCSSEAFLKTEQKLVYKKHNALFWNSFSSCVFTKSVRIIQTFFTIKLNQHTHR